MAIPDTTTSESAEDHSASGGQLQDGDLLDAQDWQELRHPPRNFVWRYMKDGRKASPARITALRNMGPPLVGSIPRRVVLGVDSGQRLGHAILVPADWTLDIYVRHFQLDNDETWDASAIEAELEEAERARQAEVDAWWQPDEPPNPPPESAYTLRSSTAGPRLPSAERVDRGRSTSFPPTNGQPREDPPLEGAPSASTFRANPFPPSPPNGGYGGPTRVYYPPMPRGTAEPAALPSSSEAAARGLLNHPGANHLINFPEPPPTPPGWSKVPFHLPNRGSSRSPPRSPLERPQARYGHVEAPPARSDPESTWETKKFLETLGLRGVTAPTSHAPRGESRSRPARGRFNASRAHSPRRSRSSSSLEARAGWRQAGRENSPGKIRIPADIWNTAFNPRRPPPHPRSMQPSAPPHVSKGARPRHPPPAPPGRRHSNSMTRDRPPGRPSSRTSNTTVPLGTVLHPPTADLPVPNPRRARPSSTYGPPRTSHPGLPMVPPSTARLFQHGLTEPERSHETTRAAGAYGGAPSQSERRDGPLSAPHSLSPAGWANHYRPPSREKDMSERSRSRHSHTEPKARNEWEYTRRRQEREREQRKNFKKVQLERGKRRALPNHHMLAIEGPAPVVDLSKPPPRLPAQTTNEEGWDFDPRDWPYDFPDDFIFPEDSIREQLMIEADIKHRQEEEGTRSKYVVTPTGVYRRGTAPSEAAPDQDPGDPLHSQPLPKWDVTNVRTSEGDGLYFRRVPAGRSEQGGKPLTSTANKAYQMQILW